MNRHRDQNLEMGIQDFFAWRSQPAANELAITDDEISADVDEPPDHHARREQSLPGFHKSTVRLAHERTESLLTKAFQQTPVLDTHQNEIQLDTDLTRRRSMMSNASIASTAELTSDGGLTSPARTNTPSPPFPNAAYTSFAPYSLASKSVHPTPLIAKVESKDVASVPEIVNASPKVEPVVVAAPRKRCITFMCDAKKDAKPTATPTAVPEPAPVTTKNEAPQPRRCTIKFACPGPKPSAKPTKTTASTSPQPQPLETKRVTARSPSIPRKSPRPSAPSRPHRDSTSTVRRVSPVAVRAKPKYIIADENTLQSSEATRFHEFASEELQEDDWIRKDAEVPKAKLTINDTLEMENRIRRLGNEAEEEALEDEDDEDEDEEGNISDDEGDSDSQEEAGDIEDLVEGSDFEASDGNETDNEAGFAESDDESDAEGDFAFWTPGRKIRSREIGQATTYRASAHRTASASSIDSLDHMEPLKEERRLRRRPIKIRPGTPDLPDSTDFVCGTLDEDRPLEDAYVSCMEARKNRKHKQTPQDIDPSFPTSDPEDEEDKRDHAEATNDSDEHVWLHGKFEESDEELHHGRRRSVTTRRKSPGNSPRRLHSPPPLRRMHSPPPKHRLRSPPPRKLFGHSPKRIHSPPPARTIRSPPASPTTQGAAINFLPLGSRPGLTHTKSLPRTPNAFCRQYQASRLDYATGNGLEPGENDGPQRGAIDIVKGLEQKRQRRKEKFYQKHCNRKNKGHGERPKPQPGKGAERMRELGLLMAGKIGAQDPYMMSA